MILGFFGWGVRVWFFWGGGGEGGSVWVLGGKKGLDFWGGGGDLGFGGREGGGKGWGFFEWGILGVFWREEEGGSFPIKHFN